MKFSIQILHGIRRRVIYGSVGQIRGNSLIIQHAILILFPTYINLHLVMPQIDKYLFEAERMMKLLGYDLHARFIWDKENGVAPAFTVRFSHEYLLWFYKKGHMYMPVRNMRGKYTTVLREQSTKHSKKPLCAYEMIESMFPDARKIELFARNERDGWDCWGNEV